MVLCVLMNTNGLNDWLTLLANIGVVIGLGVVVFEVRESNLQATSAANMARYTEIETSMRDYALSDYLPDIYVLIKASGVDSLSDAQLSRVQSWEMARIVRMEGQFVQYQDGYLPETGYQIMLNTARKNEQLWKEIKVHSENADFRIAIESDGDA